MYRLLYLLILLRSFLLSSCISRGTHFLRCYHFIQLAIYIIHCWMVSLIILLVVLKNGIIMLRQTCSEHMVSLTTTSIQSLILILSFTFIEFNKKMSVLISYSVLLFFNYLTEIISVAILYEFYPIISYFFYMMTPSWMEVTRSLTHAFYILTY